MKPCFFAVIQAIFKKRSTGPDGKTKLTFEILSVYKRGKCYFSARCRVKESSLTLPPHLFPIAGS